MVSVIRSVSQRCMPVFLFCVHLFVIRCFQNTLIFRSCWKLCVVPLDRFWTCSASSSRFAIISEVSHGRKATFFFGGIRVKIRFLANENKSTDLYTGVQCDRGTIAIESEHLCLAVHMITDHFYSNARQVQVRCCNPHYPTKQ